MSIKKYNPERLRYVFIVIVKINMVNFNNYLFMDTFHQRSYEYHDKWVVLSTVKFLDFDSVTF